MKKTARLMTLLIILLSAFNFMGCSSSALGGGNGTGTEIIEANKALELLGKEKVVFVDMQKAADYSKSHVDTAVNIIMGDIVVNTPFPNMLPPKYRIEDVLGKAGISNDTTVVVYDNNNNMEAARLWWTLKVYGHEKVKVVSGGWTALQAAGAKLSSEAPSVNAVKYTAKDVDTTMLASIEEVKSQINNPDKNVILIDTRSKEEFEAGTIPTSVFIEYLQNDYKDGRYKSFQDIKMMYLDYKIKPENTAILYCKTSVRGAQTYLALYNAGYRNLKLYDGAWVEWSADSTNPVQMPDGSSAVGPGKSDNS